MLLLAHAHTQAGTAVVHVAAAVVTGRLQPGAVRLHPAHVDPLARLYDRLERRLWDEHVGKQDVDGVLSGLRRPVAHHARPVALVEALDARLRRPLDRQTEPAGARVARVDRELGGAVRHPALQPRAVRLDTRRVPLRRRHLARHRRHRARAIGHRLAGEHHAHRVGPRLRQRELGSEPVDRLLNFGCHYLAGRTDDRHLHLAVAGAGRDDVKVDLLADGDLWTDTRLTHSH